MEELPDRMTGDDLVAQENYEAGVEREYFNSLDLVDRRDKQDHIQSRTSTRRWRDNFDKIRWDRSAS